jgi:CRP-like cAMP-binding protein
MRLNDLTLFDDVSEQIKIDLSKSTVIAYKKSQYIHFNGDSCDSVEWIIEGIVEVEHLSETGEKLIVRRLKENNSIGLNLVFSRNPVYLMNFIVKEPVKLIRINKKVLLDIMAKDSAFLSNVLLQISDNSIKFGQRLKNDFRVTIRNQLQTYLHALYIKQKSDIIVLPISKTDLAMRFGVSRTSVSRELNRMQQEGLLIVKGKEIVLNKIFIKEKR